jgi:hypothetical protein
MAVDFRYIFSCIASRSPHNGKESLIERTPILRTYNGAEIEMMRLEKIDWSMKRKDLGGNFLRCGTTYPDDGDSPLARRSCYSRNGIMLIHSL